MTNKYVQTASGKWYSMGIAMKDLTDISATKMTCRRGGRDTVNGESAVTYEIQMDDDGAMTASKIWVTSKNLVVKAAGSTESTRYVTT